MIFWNNNSIKPKPSSTAEKTKKKKVRDNKFKLSCVKPVNNDMTYKVIHNISAIKSKLRELLTLTNRFKKIKKKNKKSMFKSPIIKLFFLYWNSNFMC